MRAAVAPPRFVGRYAVYSEISSGGMGSVNYGRLLGPVGFSRTVAIKCLHPQFAKDPDFVSMFIDEAKLAARVHHQNVVQTTDVVALENELFLVMDFIQGESLSKLLRICQASGTRIPLDVASAIVVGTLNGLHAAHEATNEKGESLQIVHRDVSPQNVLVGTDGVARVLDFGIAKAAGRATSTRDGTLKGKIAYMAPEHLRGENIDRRSDIFATGVVLWEVLTGTRLFAGDNDGTTVSNVLNREVKPPSSFFTDIPKVVDDVVAKALTRDVGKRYQTALEMALALEAAVPVASSMNVARFVSQLAGKDIEQRARTIAAIEEASHNEIQAREAIPNASPADVVEADATRLEATRSERTKPTSRAVAPLALGLGMLVLALLGVVGGFYLSRPEAAPPAPVEVVKHEEKPAPVPEPVAPPEVAPAPEPTPAPAPVRVARPVTKAPARPVAAKPADGNCGLRSYFDENGIKHYTTKCQ